MKTWLPWLLATLLALLLVITNGLWLYANLDLGVSLAHRDQSRRDHCKALTSCMAVMPRVAAGKTREQILTAARASIVDDDEFEKDGAVWRGSIGLRFADDRLAAVVPAWEPFECPE